MTVLDEDNASPETGILSKIFASCAPDPRGSVHRAWSLSLLFIVFFFVLAIFEGKSKVHSHTFSGP